MAVCYYGRNKDKYVSLDLLENSTSLMLQSLYFIKYSSVVQMIFASPHRALISCYRQNMHFERLCRLWRSGAESNKVGQSGAQYDVVCVCA